MYQRYMKASEKYYSHREEKQAEYAEIASSMEIYGIYTTGLYVFYKLIHVMVKTIFY